ncbi:MAG: hypothetical protein QM704_15985 [Anaeromyxobacteraceae bacterium]
MLPLHPRLVHLPIALAVLMPLVTSGLLLAWWRGWLPRRAWVVAVVLQGALVVGGIAAIRSGEGDEKRAQTVVTEAQLEEHEDAGKALTGAGLVVLALAAAGLLVKAEGAGRAAAAAAVAGSLVVLLLAWRAGELGGRLVYVHGGASAWRPVPGAAMPAPARQGE